MLSVSDASLSASPYGQLVRNMTVLELKAEAVRVDIKHPGVGWSKCCPPTGNKSDIIAAVLGESASTSALPEDPTADPCESMQHQKRINTSAHWKEVQWKDSGFTKEWQWHSDTQLIAAARCLNAPLVRTLLNQLADPTLESCPTDDVFQTAAVAAVGKDRQQRAVFGFACPAGELGWLCESEPQRDENVQAADRQFGRSDRELHRRWAANSSAEASARCLLEARANQVCVVELLAAAGRFWGTASYRSAHYSATNARSFTNRPSDVAALRAALTAVPVPVVPAAEELLLTAQQIDVQQRAAAARKTAEQARRLRAETAKAEAAEARIAAKIHAQKLQRAERQKKWLTGLVKGTCHGGCGGSAVLKCVGSCCKTCCTGPCPAKKHPRAAGFIFREHVNAKQVCTFIPDPVGRALELLSNSSQAAVDCTLVCKLCSKGPFSTAAQRAEHEQSKGHRKMMLARCSVDSHLQQGYERGAGASAQAAVKTKADVAKVKTVASAKAPAVAGSRSGNAKAPAIVKAKASPVVEATVTTKALVKAEAPDVAATKQNATVKAETPSEVFFSAAFSAAVDAAETASAEQVERTAENAAAAGGYMCIGQFEPQSPAVEALQSAHQEQQSNEQPTEKLNADLSHTAHEAPSAWTEKRTTQHLQKKGRKQQKKKGRKQQTKKVSILVKDKKSVHPAQRLRQLAWRGTVHAARVVLSSWKQQATDSIETCALATITSPKFRYHAVKEWQRLRREKYAAEAKVTEDAANLRDAYSRFRTGDVSGELLITIISWLGDSDNTAAHASAACREWKVLATKGFQNRFAVAVCEASRVLNRIPQYKEYCESGKQVHGLCEQEIAAAEALLRGDGPDYEDEDRIMLGSRMCHRKLPSFIRAICSLIGGREICKVFSGGDSRRARLCMLRAHEMKTVGEYIEQWDLVDDCIDVYTGYNNCTLSQALVFACQDDGEDLADYWLYCWQRNRVYRWCPLLSSTPAEFDVSEWKHLVAPSDEWFCCVAEAMPHSTHCTDAIHTMLKQIHPCASLSYDATKCIMKFVAYVCHQLAISVQYDVEQVHSAGPGATPLIQSAVQGKQTSEPAAALSVGDVPFTPSILAAPFMPATAKPTTPADGAALAKLVQQTSIEPNTAAEVGIGRIQSAVSRTLSVSTAKVFVPHNFCRYFEAFTFCLSLSLTVHRGLPLFAASL